MSEAQVRQALQMLNKMGQDNQLSYCLSDLLLPDK